AAGLSSAVGASETARRCYVRQWVRFGLGSEGTRDAFACETAGLERAFASGERPLREGVLSLVTSSAVRFRDGPAGGDPGASVQRMPMQPTPVAPPPAGELDVQRRSSSDWGAGYCDDVTVKNTGAAAKDWRIVLAVTGTITQAWNSMHVSAAGGVEFTG